MCWFSPLGGQFTSNQAESVVCRAEPGVGPRTHPFCFVVEGTPALLLTQALLTFEEEINRVGINAILDGIKDFPVRPAMCVVGEPTNMRVVVAHKGKKSIRCRVRGFECHSSLAPTGVNAIEYAAEASYAPLVALREGDWKYTRCTLDPEQLFDLATDPHELTNLFDKPGLQDVARSMTRQLVQYAREHQDEHARVPRIQAAMMKTVGK